MSHVPRRAQQGQSTIEFVVAALVLVPLFIAVPLLGKYIDLHQTIEVASRYVAFEGMARNSSSRWKGDAALNQEVRRRFFSNSGAPIKTGDTAGDFTSHRNPVWSDHTGKPLIARFDGDVSVSATASNKEPLANATTFGRRLGLSHDNWHQGNVTVHIAATSTLPAWTATRRTALLVDAWTARNPAQIRERIQDGGASLYPVGAIKAFADLIGRIPTAVNDPALKIADHDWDIVPCDRLRPGC